MRPIYFLSDVHFGSGNEEAAKQRRIRSFFQHVCKTGQALYIVGDYFDFWFEYRHAIPKSCLAGYHELLLLKDSGVDIHYLLGNHDQWALDLFERDLGATVYRSPTTIRLFGLQIHLHHGDGVSSLDRRYRLLKRLFHNPLSRTFYRWIHPDVGLPVGRRFSDHSKNKDLHFDKYRDDDSIEPWLQEQFACGIDVVVMGHHHLPIQKSFGNHQYINLGDWVRHASYLEVSEGLVELKFWQEEL